MPQPTFMRKIALFYHCLFFNGQPPQLTPSGVEVVSEQMGVISQNGLLDAAEYFSVGVNGGNESQVYVSMLIPPKAIVHYHGLDSHNENSTLVNLEQWLPGHAGWYVLYFHSKGATWPYDDYLRSRWRGCMMKHCVLNWQQCVKDLDAGYESVGCHWMTFPQTPKGQSIWAGTFFWTKSDFLLTLPSIMQRERIKQSGLKHRDSRYESEVWIGNGPRLPKVKDYHGPGWNPSRVSTCIT